MAGKPTVMATMSSLALAFVLSTRPSPCETLFTEGGLVFGFTSSGGVNNGPSYAPTSLSNSRPLCAFRLRPDM